MSDASDVLPEVKQIVGAMLFAARVPLTVKQMKSVFPRVALNYGGMTESFGSVTESDLAAAVQALVEEYAKARTGVSVVEVAGGYRLQNDRNCGPWLRELLEKGRPNRLSRPALETLSVIAYRQPCTRAEVETVRGVASDNIIRNLVEMQLIKVAGRSEQVGKPWLFGTTPLFLEHFGLNSLEDLPNLRELRRNAAELLEQLELKAAAPHNVETSDLSTPAGEDEEVQSTPSATAEEPPPVETAPPEETP